MKKPIYSILALSLLVVSCAANNSGSGAKSADATSDCENAFADAKQDDAYTDKITEALDGVKDLKFVGCRHGILAKHTEIDPGNKTAWFAELSYAYSLERTERVHLRLYYQSNPEVKVLNLTRTQGEEQGIAKNAVSLYIPSASFGSKVQAEEEKLLKSGYEKAAVLGTYHTSVGDTPAQPDSRLYYDVEVRYEKTGHPTLLRIFKIEQRDTDGHPYQVPFRAVSFEEVTGVGEI